MVDKIAGIDFLSEIPERFLVRDPGPLSPPKDKPMTMDTAVDEAQERIKLKDEIAELKHDKTMLELEVSNLNYIISELRMEK